MEELKNINWKNVKHLHAITLGVILFFVLRSYPCDTYTYDIRNDFFFVFCECGSVCVCLQFYD